MSAYAPRTVAVATVRGVEGVRVMRTSGKGGGDDIWLSVEHVGGWRSHTATDVTDVRPLVVLDLADAPQFPEQSGDIAGLVRELGRRDPMRDIAPVRTSAMNWLADQIEAQTKPPRIDEPGPWGVVQAGIHGDPRRYAYVRESDGLWYTLRGAQRQWDELIDPTLVREGVTE